MPAVNGSRVLLIGLDSVDVDYLQSHLGNLPTLKRLFTGGVVRRLDSPGDVMSASVWPTFYTGTPPGEHGRYFTVQWDPASMRFRHVASDWIDSEPFWRPLAREGLPVTTLDVPMAYPSRTTAGVEVVNWGAESFGNFHCNRPDIGREIARRFGTNVLGPDVPVDKSRRRLARLRERLLAVAKRRGELCRWLMKQTAWNLFVAVFPECHRAGHLFWRDASASDAGAPDDDVVLEVHRAVDREVGALIEAAEAPDTSVVVFSLHGMETNHSQMHLVRPVIERINATFASPSGVPPAGRPRAKRNLTGLLRERLPTSIQEGVALAIPVGLRQWLVGRSYDREVDWRTTPGFALPTAGQGYVRLNVVGREARGCLARGSARYSQYLESVHEAFLSLRDAGTREPLVDSISAPGERFPGPRSDYLPDLSIAWRPVAPATAAHSDRLGTFTGRLKTGRGGNHRPAAFAAVSGPARDFPRSASLRTIIDLTGMVRNLVVGPK